MTTPDSNPPVPDKGTQADRAELAPNPPAPAYRPGPPPEPGSSPWASPGYAAGTQPQQTTPPPFQPGQPYQPVVFQPAAPEPGPVIVRPPAGKQDGRSSRLLNIALGVAVLVAAAGVAFAVGRATAPVSASTAGRFGGFGGPNASFGADGNGAFRGNGYFPGGGRGFLGAGTGTGLTIQGTVESVSSDSMTIQTASGATVTVGLGPSTTYHQQAAGSASDVQSGKTVTVEVTGGAFRSGGAGNGGTGGAGPQASGAPGGGTPTLGTASDVTVVP